ncbi:FAD-dependent oxidoreductase [Aliiroseovarius sp. 2305UL8-7]|uniref:FAD-dependent oxidoreductase n=1 Tax=Aliiroseovarius conchicola TaxID=3121637 RepID=UPI003527C608
MTRSANIGIAGAGIGGLALAILLHDRGHKPEIFERFEHPKPVGSGLVIQPVGQSILARLGCLDEVIRHGNKVIRMLGSEASSGRRVLDVHYGEALEHGRFGLSIQRASIFDALFNAALDRGIPIHTSCDISGHDGKAFLFEDSKRTKDFDLLVDASGARSRLSPLKSKQLSYGALWAKLNWVEDAGFDRTLLNQRYNGARNMIGVMNTGMMRTGETESAAFFWSLPSDSYQDWRSAGLSRWRDEAVRLWPETEPFVQQVTDPDQFTMARYTHGTLRRPYEDGIAFIGDAAHRASPQLGQGANMALLDAAALADALDRHAPAQATVAYARARRVHVAIYQAMSWVFTPMYQSNSRVLPVLRNNLLFPLSLIPPAPRVLTSLVCGTMTNPIRYLPQTTPSTRVSQSR